MIGRSPSSGRVRRRPPPKIGKAVYLPSSFHGGPRHLHQCYLDAMALVARYGRPDAFITMTASPRWPEVQANLRPGELAHNRPDLIARVFRQKLRALLRDLTVNHHLGRVIAYTYVIEFQKRGLPHAHILLIFDSASKPRSAKDVDRLVTAELPTGPEQQELRKIVESCMVHGPCGPELNPTCSCMKDGACSNKYPKAFRDETSWCEGGYPPLPPSRVHARSESHARG